MLIVAVAAIITGLAAHFPPEKILAEIGTGFIKTRNIPLIILLPLAVIGLLERHGLRERAQTWIGGIKARDRRASADRLSAGARTDRRGRSDRAGRPSADGASADRADGRRRDRNPVRQAIRRQRCASSCARTRAATDNVGLFFGEDIFVAFGAIVLMTTFLKEAGIVVEPLHVAVWGIPTAICAFLVHGFRL